MAKGLFTSLEEIKFQDAFVNGNVIPARDPKTKRNPIETRHLVCSKKKNRQVSKNFYGRTR